MTFSLEIFYFYCISKSLAEKVTSPPGEMHEAGRAQSDPPLPLFFFTPPLQSLVPSDKQHSIFDRVLPPSPPHVDVE